MNESEDLYRAVFPSNAHLAPSRNTHGAVRGALLDNETNKLAGQAEFLKVALREGDSEHGTVLASAVVGLSVGIAGTIVASKLAPAVKDWWLDDARPMLEAKWSRLTRSTKNQGPALVLAFSGQDEIDGPRISQEESPRSA